MTAHNILFYIQSGLAYHEEDVHKLLERRYQPYLEDIETQMAAISQEREEVIEMIDKLEDEMEKLYVQLSRQGGVLYNAFWELMVFVVMLYGLKNKSPLCLKFVLMSPVLKIGFMICGILYVGTNITRAVYEDLLTINPDDYVLTSVLILVTLDHQNVTIFASKAFGISFGTIGVIIAVYYILIVRCRSQMLQNSEKKKTKLIAKKKVFSKKFFFKLQVSKECFFHACLYGHCDIIRQLISENEMDLSKNDISKNEPFTGYSGFHLACAGGHLSIIQQLLTRFGKDFCNNLVSKDGKTGLEVSAEHGRKDVVHTILKTINNKNMR